MPGEYQQYLSEEHQQDKEKCVTASDILYWTWNPELKNFIKMELSKYKDYTDEYFRRYGDHLYIIESGLRGLSAKDIANIATAHKQKTRKPVVVFIDYLQLLKADPKDPSQTDRKTKIDRSAVILKTLASQIGMPVVTISSISRNNYNEKSILLLLKNLVIWNIPEGYCWAGTGAG